MRIGRLVLVAAVLLSGCDARAGLASIGGQDLPSGPSYRVTGTITVGKWPMGVAVDPGTHTVYVANSEDGTVSVIDAATRTVVATIPVGGEPHGIAVDSSTHAVYVTQPEFGKTGTVSVIDGVTRAVVATVPVGTEPWNNPAVDPLSHLVYVGNFSDSTITIIDGRTYAVADTVSVRAQLNQVAVDPEAKTIYVSTERRGRGGNTPSTGDDTVQVIDAATRTVTATIPFEDSPDAVLVDPSTHAVYVFGPGKEHMSVIDGSTRAVEATVPIDGGIGQAADIDPSTHTLYVSTWRKKRGEGGVTVIDGPTHSVTAQVRIGGDPRGVAVDPGTHTVYLADGKGGVVSIIENVPG